MRAGAASLEFTTCDAFLAALAEPGVERLDGTGVAAVFAHPDDETIACGAQLARLDGVRMVVVTDGAPRDLCDARRLGFETAQDYAAARHLELLEALDLAGVDAGRIMALGVPDQQAALRLPEISRELAKMFAKQDIGIVITHAYEGGHPDHDATAFCVHAAARLQLRAGRPVGIVEAPLYRRGENGIVRQEFDDGASGAELVLRLNESQQALKREMIAAHRTQRDTLSPFGAEVERFRPAPDYDFSEKPNEGRFLYEDYSWGLTGSQWIVLARSALAELAEELC